MPTCLQEKRAAVLERWIALTLATYPAEAEKVFARKNDEFRNPIGHAVRAALSALEQHLFGETINSESLERALDDLIRLRAVQNFTASEAVGFVFLLKQALREELGEQGVDAANLPILEKIDHLALKAFDVYMQCREQLYQARMRDALGRPSPALQRRNGAAASSSAAEPNLCASGVGASGVRANGACETCDSCARD